MVTAELGPQARATVAGDSVAALSKALRQLGHTVSVALPRYPSHESSGLLLARRLSPLVIEPSLEVTVLDGQLASGVSLVLFDAPAFAEPRPIFGAPGSREAESDGARSALLCRAVEALVRERRAIGKAPDVIHLHDWSAAPLAALSREEGSPPCVFTVHDVRPEPSFDPKTLGLLGQAAYDERALSNGRLSPLRLGLAAASVATTVSAGYAQELEAGELGPVLRARATPLAGVLDGLDYAVYNPATDSALEARYDAEDPSNKARSKTALLRALELELDVERPLLVVLLNKDGADSKLVLSSITRLLDQDLSVVAAGAGAQSDAVRAALSAMRSEHPGDFGVVERSDEPELRRLMAAADFVLTVRRGVPCAYEELCAQRYGAVPIAHASGGVTDVVVDIDAELETGTGLCFTDLTESALVGVVERALSAYGHPQFSALRRRLLRKDLGWDRAARRYLQIYRQARGENALG